MRQQLGDVPELLQRIQLELPSKDAARTCILSKSWLHAWSTSPAIRFCSLKKKQRQRKYMRWIHLALLRYHRHNLPITSLDLQLGIHTTNYRDAQKLIKQAITSSLKELRLAILVVSFTLPDEIFSNENLNTLILELISPFENNNHSLHISNLAVVRCTNLRVLELSHVNNLRYLCEFIVCLSTHGWIDILEIHDAPSLRSLVFKAPLLMWDRPPSSFEIRKIGSLTKLQLDNVYMDDAFSNMIISNFPFLEELTLEIKWSSIENGDAEIEMTQKHQKKPPTELKRLFSNKKKVQFDICNKKQYRTTQ
ncbi:pleckstrin domain superfamily protein [Tanacetum coccineum]